MPRLHHSTRNLNSDLKVEWCNRGTVVRSPIRATHILLLPSCCRAIFSNPLNRLLLSVWSTSHLATLACALLQPPTLLSVYYFTPPNTTISRSAPWVILLQLHQQHYHQRKTWLSWSQQHHQQGDTRTTLKKSVSWSSTSSSSSMRYFRKSLPFFLVLIFVNPFKLYSKTFSALVCSVLLSHDDTTVAFEAISSKKSLSTSLTIRHIL